MSIPRLVGAEWLDELPESDPRAVRSRRDLKRVNVLMLQARIMKQLLEKHRSRKTPCRLLDIGAGDGTFTLSVARMLGRNWTGTQVILLDRQNIVATETRDEFAKLGWKTETVTGDIFDYLRPEKPTADIVTASLFLHHFSRGQLARLLYGVAQIADAFVACEPRRGAVPLLASKMLGIVGCNDVTRHDAVVSVRAGFCGSEISELWPAGEMWSISEFGSLPFSHCFAARRTQQERRHV